MSGCSLGGSRALGIVFLVVGLGVFLGVLGEGWEVLLRGGIMFCEWCGNSLKFKSDKVEVVSISWVLVFRIIVFYFIFKYVVK